MTIKSVMKDRMPLSVQDRLRNVVELVDPRRRAARRARGVSQREADDLARHVSPSGTVLAGVFGGMKMESVTSSGSMAPLLAGTYEEELGPFVERLIGRAPGVVVNVGSGEGYYAVGFAMRLPAAAVYAFDIDPSAKPLCRANARMNSVSNVTVRGRIDHAELNRLLAGSGLVISDCEGFEAELLDPALVPNLINADLLVELHDFIDPTISDTITSRFSGTHDVELVPFAVRSVEDRPQLAHLSAEQAVAAMAEGRPTEPWPMQWAVITRRHA